MVVQPAVSDDAGIIRIVAAVIRDEWGRNLLVRKRGATVFQQPGGKRDPGDADELATLARELREELGCELVAGTVLDRSGRAERTCEHILPLLRGASA